MGRKRDWTLCLKADDRFIEAAIWPHWMEQVARTRDGFANFIDYDPMTNETASVGVLASAAARADLLSTTEFVCHKHQFDRRRRLVHGRADLWVGAPRGGISWAFEAKQIKSRQGSRSDTFEAALDMACLEASRLPEWEANRFFGLLIVTVPPEGDVTKLEGRLESLAGKADFAWPCGGRERATYLYFRKV